MKPPCCVAARREGGGKRMPRSVQLNLPPGLLRNSEHPAPLLRNSEQGDQALQKSEHAALSADDADLLSKQLIDEAMEAAGITNDAAAFVLGVSSSLVGKMRSVTNRERMSHAQMLRLGPAFYIELHCALDKRTGWFRRFAMHLQQQAATFFSLAVTR